MNENDSKISVVGLTSSALLLSGCEVIGGILKAGVWAGAVAVTGVMLATGALVGLLRR